MKNLFLKHWQAVVLAGILGAIIILPTILSVQKLGPGNFKGIYPILSDDEDHYLAEIREVYDGHLAMSNPYIAGYKDTPYTQPSLGAAYYAYFAKIFGISITLAAAINDFVLPFIVVLVFYALILRLTRSSRFSKRISLATTFLFFLSFVSSFGRPVNPQLSFIFLLLGLYVVWRIVEEKHPLEKLVTYNVLLSVIFGVLVYIYPFYWMTIVVIYGLVTFWLLFLDKDLSYWLRAWFSFFVPSLLFSIPFLLNLGKLAVSPFFAETNLRNGFIQTHIPGAFLDVFLMLVSLPIIYLAQKVNSENITSDNKKTMFLGYSLVIGGVILNWQNVITGKTLQFPPHLYPVMILFVFIICATSIARIDLRKPTKYGVALLCVVVIIIAGVLYKQKGEAIYALRIISSPKDVSSLQRLSPVMAWLSQNTSPDSTVYALGKDLNSLIPVYTHDNVYYVSSANIFLMPDTELENRWIILHYLDDIKSSNIYGNRDIWPNRFIDPYQNKESRRKILQFITRKSYPENVLMDSSNVDRVLKEHTDLRRAGFEKSIKSYSVDYVLLDISDLTYVDLDKVFGTYKFLDQVYAGGNIIVYKVK
ncbi:MAG TPA: hypothetical protein VJG67_02345 [Candidatus Paceibacterota bacterium]